MNRDGISRSVDIEYTYRIFIILSLIQLLLKVSCNVLFFVDK